MRYMRQEDEGDDLGRVLHRGMDGEVCVHPIPERSDPAGCGPRMLRIHAEEQRTDDAGGVRMNGDVIPGRFCSKCGGPLRAYAMDVGYVEAICLECDNGSGEKEAEE